MKPTLVDLFCGAGGASKGYVDAGFNVIGVDLNPQPNYPFAFIRADAVEFTKGFAWAGVSAVHASPPCQRFSDLAHRNGNAESWPDLVGPIRHAVSGLGIPYVIENVEGAPLLNPITLCGTMFEGLRVIRHRLFESNFKLEAPPHPTGHPLVFTHDKRKAHYGKLNQDESFVQVTGGGNCTVANKRSSMKVPWMTGREANEAIPPAYTEYVGRQLLEGLT